MHETTMTIRRPSQDSPQTQMDNFPSLNSAGITSKAASAAKETRLPSPPKNNDHCCRKPKPIKPDQTKQRPNGARPPSTNPDNDSIIHGHCGPTSSDSNHANTTDPSASNAAASPTPSPAFANPEISALALSACSTAALPLLQLKRKHQRAIIVSTKAPAAAEEEEEEGKKSPKRRRRRPDSATLMMMWPREFHGRRVVVVGGSRGVPLQWDRDPPPKPELSEREEEEEEEEEADARLGQEAEEKVEVGGSRERPNIPGPDPGPPPTKPLPPTPSR